MGIQLRVNRERYVGMLKIKIYIDVNRGNIDYWKPVNENKI